jgi:hypothetical protein
MSCYPGKQAVPYFSSSEVSAIQTLQCEALLLGPLGDVPCPRTLLGGSCRAFGTA